MIIKYILLNILILLCKTIKVQGDVCSCEDLQVSECLNSNKCSINGNVCGNLICSNRSSGQCSSTDTNYKCKWNASTQTCLDYTYTCSEIPLTDCSYNSQKGINCVPDANQKCVEFSCALASFNCPRNLCSYTYNGVCSNPIQELNCSTLSNNLCDFYYDGVGHVCNLNDAGKCTSYNLYGLNFRCSEWSDSKNGCQKINCIYDEDTKKCREFKCIEIIDQNYCTKYNYNNEFKIVELCKWYQGQCSSLEITDITNFKDYECQEKTGNRFCWNSNYGCQPCKQMQIINSDPDLCNTCIKQINTCAKLNNTYSYLTNICFEKITCPTCQTGSTCPTCSTCSTCPTCPTSLKNMTCSDLTKNYGTLISQCYSKDTENSTNTNCPKTISSCSDLVNNHNIQCNKDLKQDIYCTKQDILQYKSCEDLKLQYSDILPTWFDCDYQNVCIECSNNTEKTTYMVLFIILLIYFFGTLIYMIHKKWISTTQIAIPIDNGDLDGDLQR
ncbi:unnamed protein product [Paramecium primaurelia]|uniref:Uncharacterized protein n=1 Tax=Paramecium primaurelia TaxID=5886 RepID=A0A8S1P9X9_PARPR|nr:unnamed protein product [Paramecium primaurelia]